MADRKPPKMVGGEIETWIALYAFQRDSLLSKLDGVSEADARRPAVRSGTSLTWLVKHCARAERVWLFDRFAALETVPQDDAVLDEDTVASVSAQFREQWLEIVELVQASGASRLAVRPSPSDEPITLRWILGHLLEEVARHAGHADIIREQLDGQTGR